MMGQEEDGAGRMMGQDERKFNYFFLAFFTYIVILTMYTRF